MLWGTPGVRLGRRLAVLTVVLAGLSASPALAATITVATTQDVVGYGPCSLREAVTAANTGAAFGACAAGDPSGTRIVLGSGHYVLYDGELVVSSSITIVGQGVGATTIDGDGLSRVLGVGSTGRLMLSGLTLTGGRAPDGASAPSATGQPGGNGGAVENVGVLTLDHVAVVGNRAGNGGAGISFSWGAVTGGRGGNGGGIESAGPSLTIVDSTIANNRAGDGGAEAAAGGRGGGVDVTGGSVSITRSTISANVAGNAATAPLPGAPGGAGGGLAMSNSALATLSNDTVANNAAGRGSGLGGSDGGAIYQTGGRLTLRHVTVAGNTEQEFTVWRGRMTYVGAMISTTGEMTISNSAIEATCRGPVTDGGHNFSLPPVQMYYSYSQPACPGRQLQAPAFNLGPLQNNGGPTETMLPRPGSPLIGGVPRKGAGCLASDQRGVARPQGPACDAGAVELRAPRITVQPRPVRFGPTRIGQVRRTTVRVRITTGELPLSLGRARITGPNARDFAVVKNRCRGKTLNRGRSCTLAISFRPRAPGRCAAQVTLNVRIPGTPAKIALVGTGMP